MTVILLLVLLLALTSADIAPTLHADWLLPARTRGWKGLFTLLILLSHFTGYIPTGPADETYLTVRSIMGQSLVTLFLFCSGFGMMKRAMADGRGYLRRLPGRFLSVWAAGVASVAVMLLVQTLRGREYTGEIIAQAFLFWASIGNSTWYIFVILAEYVIFALSILPLCLRPSRLTRLAAPVLATCLTLLFVGWMQRMELEEYWYDTVLLFPLGMWGALIPEAAGRFLRRSTLRWTLLLLCTASLALWLMNSQTGDFIQHEAWLIAFTALVLTLMMKVTLTHPLLTFCGTHVLPIYLFQRVGMIVVYETGLAEASPYLSFIPVLIAACAAALIYERAAALVRRLISPKTGKA